LLIELLLNVEKSHFTSPKEVQQQFAVKVGTFAFSQC